MAEDGLTIPTARFRSSATQADARRQDYASHMSGSWQAELTDDDSRHVIETTSWNLGEMVVTLNDFPARRVARTRQQAYADQLDHYYIHLPLATAGLHVESDDDRVTVPSGEPILMDLSRPFDTYQGAGRSLQAFMPREVLDELLPRPRDLHAMPLRGAAAGLVSDLLKSLVVRLPGMSSAEATSVAKGAMYMVAASLAPCHDTLERAQPAIESTLLRQACRFIELHLTEPQLGPDMLCAALKISRASLFRMFESYGGVARHIKERRLIRIHGVLGAASGRQSLARIAEDHGFKSATHFSREFRSQFGYSPKDALPSAAPTSLAPTATAHDGSLAAWLRPLRG